MAAGNRKRFLRALDRDKPEVKARRAKAGANSPHLADGQLLELVYEALARRRTHSRTTSSR